MSIIAKMYVDDEEFTLLTFNFSLEQKSGYNGLPSSKPTGGIFNIVFESTKDALFYEWMIGENMIESLKIVLSPTSMTSKNRTILLLDLFCLRYEENFNGVDKQPLATYIQASPAIMIQDGVKIFEKSWKVTDLNSNTAPTEIEEDNEQKVIRQYITDENDVELDEYYQGDKIFYVIETQNMTGEEVDINLYNKAVDFLYQGKRLENDIIKNYVIGSELDKVSLEVISEDYQEV